MAHHTTIQAYAAASYERGTLQRKLSDTDKELARLRPEVLKHLQRSGAVTCEVSGTAELVTLAEGWPDTFTIKPAIIATVSRANEAR